MGTSEKMLVESYKFAAMRTGVGMYGLRLFLRIVEAAQKEMEGLSFRDKTDIRKVDVVTETNLMNEREISMKLRAIIGDTHNVTDELKEDIEKLMLSKFSYETDDEWVTMPFLSAAKVKKGTRTLTVIVQPEVWDALMDFSNGFRKFSLKKAMAFKSTYSLRFYQLFALQKTPLQYKIDDLRKMFGLEEKDKNTGKFVSYKTTSEFIRGTIEAAKEELDSCSPYTFAFEPQYTGKAITSILFIPKYQAQFDSEAAQKKALVAQYPGALALFNQKQEAYLKEHFGITHRGIEQNRALFKAAKDNDLLNNLVKKLIRRMEKLEQNGKPVSNKAGYLINSISIELSERGISIDDNAAKAAEKSVGGRKPREA